MHFNCQRCGSGFECRAPNARYCPPCRIDVQRERERKRWSVVPGYQTSGPIARLADVPASIRLAAFESLLEDGELSDDEIPLAFAAAVEPGHLSTRVA